MRPEPEARQASYVLVELKQWSKAEPYGEDLVQVEHYPQPVLHPVEQVRRYCEYLVDSTPALAEQPDSVHGVAYLHNARESGVWRISQYAVDEFGELYTLDNKSKLVDRLARDCSTATRPHGTVPVTPPTSSSA